MWKAGAISLLDRDETRLSPYASSRVWTQWFQRKASQPMNSRRARTISDYWRIARRRRLVLVIPAVILGISTWVALRQMPNLYESRARMIFAAGPNDDFSGRLSSFRQQLITDQTLEAIVKKCNPAQVNSTDVATRLRSNIALEPDTSSYPQIGGFVVSVRDIDPYLARSVTDELVSRLMTQGSNNPTTSTDEVEGLRKRADELAAQLREIEEMNPRLLAARADVSAPITPPARAQSGADAIRAQQMNIEGLKDQQYKFQQQLADVERRIGAQRQVVEQQKKSSTIRDNPTYGVLIARRAELQGQRDTLINRQELTDKHPRVLSINDQIAAINRQIEELQQQDVAVVGQSAEARELASLESERNRLKLDLEVTGRELSRRSASTPALVTPEYIPARREAVPVKVTQEYLSLKRNQREVISSLEAAEARLKATDGGQLRISETASLPEGPVSPNRVLFVALAAVAGLAMGAVFAFFAEGRRFTSLQDVRDVEHYTKLPLLAAIPRTQTPVERRKAAWGATARLALATVFSVGATFALTKIFILSNIFALIGRK